MQTDPKIDRNIQNDLKKNYLVYITDKIPGLFRQKVGKKFNYYNIAGGKINDRKILRRIEDLSIPPGWDNVWISPKENGHIQATGIDNKRRTQYIYHPGWIKLSQENKFEKIIDFGLNLPKIRRGVAYYLQKREMGKSKLIATIIWLLEHTFIRVGNEEYYRENETFGLTTLRNKHVRIIGNRVLFSFIGKSNKEAFVEISNSRIAKTIKKCSELPGFEIFKFIDNSGEKQVIDSQDVNHFLKDLTNDEFSAKDFRTWGASILSAKIFYKIGWTPDVKIIRSNINETVKKVATTLNNTIAVCKNYYIHPTVIETYQKNILLPHFDNYSKIKSRRNGLSWDEYALIKLLQKHN